MNLILLVNRVEKYSHVSAIRRLAGFFVDIFNFFLVYFFFLVTVLDNQTLISINQYLKNLHHCNILEKKR